MDNKLIDKAFERLDKAVDVLGQGAKHGYEIYVKQQVAEGVVYTGLYTLAILVIIFICYCLIKKLNKEDIYNTEVNKKDDVFFHYFITCVVLIIPIVAIVSMVAELPHNIMQIINPEYYAIKVIHKDDIM